MILRRFAPALPIEVVACRRTGAPTRLRWRGRARRVAGLEEEWEATHGWWADESEVVHRHHYRLRMADGMLCLVYRDLGSSRWYLAGIYD